MSVKKVKIEESMLKRILGDVTNGQLTRKQSLILGMTYPSRKGWRELLLSSHVSINQLNKLYNLRSEKAKANKRTKNKLIYRQHDIDNLYHNPNTIRGNKKEKVNPYLSNEWISLRNDILERDKHKCTECGATQELHVHHLAYEHGKPVWDVPMWYLVTLCKDCHKKEHSKKLAAPKKIY